MKLSILLPLIFFCSALPLAGAPDYSINVHVTESRMVREPQSAGGMQRIKVVIDGKKLELESESIPNALLSLGDYKARIVREDIGEGHPTKPIASMSSCFQTTRPDATSWSASSNDVRPNTMNACELTGSS